MPLGTEIGLGAGHIVLDADPSTPRKEVQQPPDFRGPYKPRPMSTVTKRLDESRYHLIRRQASTQATLC